MFLSGLAGGIVFLAIHPTGTTPVVGVSVMMLVEEGKIRLTDPVGKFIPELQNLKVTVPNSDGVITAAPSGAVSAPQPGRIVDAARPITVRDLITHTSGLMSGGASAAGLAARFLISLGAAELESRSPNGL